MNMTVLKVFLILIIVHSSNSNPSSPNESSNYTGSRSVDSDLKDDPKEGFPACHRAPADKATAAVITTDETIKKIDGLLQELYNSFHNLTADYEDECNYSIPHAPGSDSVELTLQLERLEQLRSNYERGLWGYCSVAGSTKLMKDIKELTEVIKAAKPYPTTICDRQKLLMCHKKYNKCKCIVDNRNFRNIVGEYWDVDDADADPDAKKEMKESACVLTLGSDCPFLPHGKVRCVPGTKCLYKDTKKPCKLRSGMSHPINPKMNTNYTFTNHKFSTIYCQCYSYFVSKGIRVAACPMIIIILIVSKYFF